MLDTLSSDEEDLDQCEDEVDIPACDGIPRGLWATKFVTLKNDSGIPIAEGICHSVKSDLVIGSSGPLGNTHVAVHVCKTLLDDETLDGWRYSVRAWPITNVYYNGASLRDHERRDNYNCVLAMRRNGPNTRLSRPYNSASRQCQPPATTKTEVLLTAEAINSVSSLVCCTHNCVQPYPREKIRLLRERMYRETDFKFRNHMKLEVHRQIHRDSAGRRVVTLEGIDVCLIAWRHIMGVPETTFHRYAKLAAEGRGAQEHGNTGLRKSRSHTVQATATLRCILHRSADHMPHRSRVLSSGEKVVAKVLPSTWKWKDSIPELNEVNASFGLKEVSPSNLSKIRKRNFEEYDAKKPGDNFARCASCDRYHSLRKAATPNSQAAILWARKLKTHLDSAMAHRELYSANRYRSKFFPDECVTIMHDKMDHAKTASPVFSHKTKHLDGLMKLPVSVTGMLAHGHGDVRYAHYGLDLFSHDSNYTVGSFARLLRDLESPPKYSSRQLFATSRSSPLFSAILQGAEMCESSLPPEPTVPIPGKALPPILNVQMDNAAGDNKNRYVFCFWSLLVAKRIFREVYVNFMLVGHTHDDIDALFGRWSMSLKRESFPTIPLLMKSFMDVESVPTIPHLIEEVPDFKGFIKASIADGEEALEGHTKAQQFKFFVDSNGCPMMKYRILCNDEEWLPKEGGGIKLWKEDSQGRSLWPRGEPVALQQQPMRSLDDIVKGISGFIQYWEKLSAEDSSGEYRRRYEHLSYYWRGVKNALALPTESYNLLRDGFWPQSRINHTLEDQYNEAGTSREEFDEDEVYIGQRRDRPAPSFRVARDLYDGYFVAIRPADGDNRPVWIARAKSNPNSNPHKPTCVLIQYFRPATRSQDVQDSYRGWDSPNGLRWKIDDCQEEVWEETSSIMTAWKSRVKKGTMECVLKIPLDQIKIIHDSIASIEEMEA